ncbi:acyl-CoA N-acyltransferase [Umbelopsis sp. PMI_123]|jgi:ribosomal protein S18 acetylase RimI-like enzyme|nr:acyl-CoA N-acyltransferase [Umbelopsis sp. PMI_123]
MGQGFKFSNGLDYTLRQLVEYNNDAFVGYLKDMTFTPEIFESFLVPQHLVHGLSVYMHTEDGRFVGLSRTGVRGTRAWVAGVAIVPEFRGKGAGKVLMKEYIRVLKESGRIKKVILDVLGDNPVAKRLYESLGFKITTSVHKLMFHGEMDPPQHNTGSIRTTKGVDIHLPWLHYEMEYMWTREWCVVSIKDNAQTVRYEKEDGQLSTAVVVYIDDSKQTLLVHACAFTKDTTANDLRAIFAQFSKEHNITIFMLPYEPAESKAISLFQELEFKETDMEYIMELDL